MSPYKFSPGDKFINKKNNKSGFVLRIAKLDEFGGDFYFEEKNYVVVFDDDSINPIATYNFLNTTTTPISYNYVMTENDMIEEPKVLFEPPVQGMIPGDESRG
jgi:hypothetical protein